MDNLERVIGLVLSELQKMEKDLRFEGIPVGVSNRHIHLSKEHLNCIFGEGYELTKMKDLSQPGQYAASECVTLVGPKGCMEGVRILGPTRSETQVELLAGDCFKLGVKAPLKISGDLCGTPGIIVCGPKGSVTLKNGVIVAKRHIHMTPEDARRYNCKDGDLVELTCQSERGGTLSQVVIRVTETSKLDFHLDTEEANCMGITGKDKVNIVRKDK